MHPIFYEEMIFHEPYHYFCVKNTVFQVLKQYGFNELLIHQLLNVYFQLKVEMKHQQFYIDQQTPTLPFSMEDIVKVRKNMILTDGLEACKAQLSRNNAVIASADTYYLPYRVEYGKKHACHSVILTEITDAYVCVVDWYPPHFYKGSLSMSQWQLAWNSKNPFDDNPFSGKPIGCEWLTVDFARCSQYASRLRKQNLDSMFEKNETIQSITLLIKMLFYSAGRIEKSQILLFHDALFLHSRASKQAVQFLESLTGLKEHLRGNEVLILFYRMSDILERINNQLLLAYAGVTQRRIDKIIGLLNEYANNRGKLSLDLKKALEEVCNGQENGVSVGSP